jgi:hypothetical protein
MNIMPGAQRKLVAAALLKEVFDRAPYGCKLFCCWCRQDLSANHFWESMGFVPLAFRADAKGKLAHIFWQRRIRQGDAETPLWFPAKTEGGMMREDRIVLPIPPGVHWSDEMPILVSEQQKALPSSPRTPKPEPRNPTPRRAQFGPPSDGPEPIVEKVTPNAKPAKKKRQKIKADPVLVAKAKELRDRYLEQLNAGKLLAVGKYEVARAIEAKPKPMMLQQAA